MTRRVRCKHLVLGLDGADLDLIREFGPGVLPNLFRLMARGTFGRLESVQPPATLPNWTSFLTGTDPGHHGVFDFTTRSGYSVAFTAGTAREVSTLASRLDALGHRCAVMGFPATWPAERLEHGLFMSGWDAPVAFEADRSFVWPESFYDELTSKFGPPQFDDVNEFEADKPGWLDALPEALVERVRKKRELFRFVLERAKNEPWDLCAFYFGESDTASHYLYSLHDPDSPRRPDLVPDSEGLCRVYRALDEAVGELVHLAGPDVELTVVSDHGSGGSSDRVLYLNRALEASGLCTFRDTRSTQRVVSAAKEFALTRLPPSIKERLFMVAGRALPGALESKVRFGALDMARTEAFSDELNYFPGVYFNVKGREPLGTVEPRDLSALTHRVTAALLALRDPYSGDPVVQEVHPRDSLYRGPYVDRAPDLLLTLHRPDGYSYNLMPSADAARGTCFRRLRPSEYLGRKGRSLPGSHRSHGFFLMHGPSIAELGEAEAHIMDASASLLARMRIAVPKDFGGRVRFEFFKASYTRYGMGGTLGELVQHGPDGVTHRALPQDDGRPELHRLPAVRERRRGAQADFTEVERRLRALGYID